MSEFQKNDEIDNILKDGMNSRLETAYMHLIYDKIDRSDGFTDFLYKKYFEENKEEYYQIRELETLFEAHYKEDKGRFIESKEELNNSWLNFCSKYK